MAVSFSDEPIAFNAAGHDSDLAAAVAAMGGCESARERLGSDRPCEIFRLGEATAATSAEIKAGVEAPHPLFMWRYENESTRLDLVGSIHALKAALYPLPTQIETAFGEADHLVMEVDVANADPAALMQAMAKFALLPDGGRIHDSLGETHQDRLSGELRQLGMSIDLVANFKPIFLATQLGVARLAAFGYLPNHGLEFHFMSRLEDRTVHELETIEQQLAVLASPSMEDQVEILLETVDTMSEAEPLVASMVRAWFLGNDGDLMQAFEQSMAGSEANSALLEALVYDRNVTLAAGIKELLEKPGNWFVLVGAGHLPGPRGIVALLEDQGAKGRRIMSSETDQQ